MSSNTIGLKMKELRKGKKLTLKTLAERTGLSISFLSQVERGKSSVTLESLKKIADALDTNPSFFFSDDQLEEMLDVSREQFHYQDLSHGLSDALFSPILVTLKPGKNEGQAFSHSGHEFLYVVEGTLTVEIEGKRTKLNERETLMFDAKKAHYWLNLTDQTVRFLVVSSKG
ncbi:helix-turn-helix domain-containing protein [Bacillus thermotolerans]|uniref:Transcriptional regulator, MerR family n=1 Tax=Bacillus thermotolerans TaxID=1221996 RepID=A0A0F5I8F5_BACTR|nr:XRE family transcriptional regulator [Bacillus thermotolerans]KKB41550.1 Transcriptional regulator, MerR family [Bacillus thermotolerans]